MAKVAIVYPYFRTRTAQETLFPPLGAAGLAAQLRHRAIETRVFDGTFTTFSQLLRSLTTYKPDIVGIYAMVTLSANALRIASAVRARLPDALLVAGGPLPTLYPEHYAESFDAVFRGEADLSFPQFCADALGQEPPPRLERLALPAYPGLFVRRGDLRVDNPPVHHSEAEIAAFPLPDRSDFDHAAYQRAWLERGGEKTTSIITTLGCPFNCEFCSKPVFGNAFRRRSLDTVLAEVEQVRGLGYDRLWIADDSFTLSPAYLEAFCERITGRDMTWSCLSRCTGIDLEMARRMKAAGCYRVYLGLESGSPETLRLMNKQVTLAEGERAVHLFRQAGIEVAAFFIVGYPGEGVASVEATLEYALSLPLDEISFNVPFPLPGSQLYDRVSGVDGSRDWSRENEVSFVYDSEFDPAWLRRRIRRTLRTFEAKQRLGFPGQAQ